MPLHKPMKMAVAFCIQGLGLGFAAAVQPGPFQTYLITRTLRTGWRRSLPAALAPLLSDGPIIILVLLLLSRLPAWMEPLLSILGGVFILYLALGAYRGWRDFDPTSLPAPTESRQSLGSAVMVNFLSPGPYLFWSLVGGPILISAWRQAPPMSFSFLVGFYLAMTLSLAAIMLVFGTARQLGPRFNRALLGLSALALAGFGLYGLTRGLSHWIIID